MWPTQDYHGWRQPLGRAMGFCSKKKKDAPVERVKGTKITESTGEQRRGEEMHRRGEEHHRNTTERAPQKEHQKSKQYRQESPQTKHRHITDTKHPRDGEATKLNLLHSGLDQPIRTEYLYCTGYCTTVLRTPYRQAPPYNTPYRQDRMRERLLVRSTEYLTGYQVDHRPSARPETPFRYLACCAFGGRGGGLGRCSAE
jgi:hypothetical protein